MRRAIEQFRNSLLEFIEQRERMLLVVACPEAESALMLKLLLDQQNASRNDLYYLIAEDFLNAEQYVDAIASRLQREQQAAAESGDDFIPVVPRECTRQSGASAATRLKKCFAYARNLVDPPTGHRIVWCLSPGKIVDVADFENLLTQCVPSGEIEPWVRGLRIFARIPERNRIGQGLASHRYVTFYPYAIPHDASEKELREDVQNVHMPLVERSHALMQLGFIDMAHGRCDAAEKGLKDSLAIGQQTGDTGMQALAMIGLGDTCRKRQDVEKAKYWYECAIVPAGEAKQIMSLAMISERFGSIAFERSRFEDAEFYYDRLTVLKRCIPDENGLVQALLWRGRSQLSNLKAELAVASFQEAVLLCKSFDIGHLESECLVELRRAYVALGRAAQGEKEAREWQMTPNLVEV